MTEIFKSLPTEFFVFLILVFIIKLIFPLKKRRRNYQQNPPKNNNPWENPEIIYTKQQIFNEFEFFKRKSKDFTALYVVMETKQGNEIPKEFQNKFKRYYKVGISNNPSMRFKSLQVDNPRPLRLRYIMYFNTNQKNVKKLEKSAHCELEKICSYRRGEWFELNKLSDIINILTEFKQNTSYFNDSDLEWHYDAYKRKLSAYRNSKKLY